MGKSKRLEAIEECRMEMENLIDVPEVGRYVMNVRRVNQFMEMTDDEYLEGLEQGSSKYD